MEVKRIITGSWFPRTKMHLKEYFAFLETGKSHLPIPKDELEKAREVLSPEEVLYVGGRFDEVVAKMRGYAVRYTEDGLLLVSKEVHALASDVIDIRSFYDDRIAKALGAIYGIGTPAVMHRIPHVGMRPIVLIVSSASQDDIDGLFAELTDVPHFVARGNEATAHFGENHIVIEDFGTSEAQMDLLVRMYVLFREYEHKLRHYLDLHRTIWESIADFRGQETLATKDLPAIRDRLLDYRRDLAVTRGRLGQMESYLAARRSAVDATGQTDWLGTLEAYRFDKVQSATAYMKELWEMLDEYIESTVAITGLLYQENLQKEINFQQFIFLVSAVAGTLTLGTIAGASISLNAPSGTSLATGSLVSFSLHDFLIFGGASLVISVVVFTLIRPIISSFRRIKVRALFRGSGTGPAGPRIET